MHVPIIIALTTDEETDLICVENIIDTFKELNIKPKFTIVGEPTKCQINNQANGCYEFLIEVFGKSCHSSIVEQGINAINIIAKLITEIEEKQNNYIDLTSNSGVINGGDIVNRVPDYCCLKFDVRATSSALVEEFLNVIKNKINTLKNEYKTEIKLTKLLEIPPLEIKNINKIQQLANFLGVDINKFMGGCEAGYYQALSGDALIFGVGDMTLAHKPNEFVYIEEYKEYSEMIIKLINKIEEKYYT